MIRVVKRNPTLDPAELHAACDLRGVTQQQLAHMTGLSLSTVSRAARGERTSPRNISALVKALDYPLTVTRFDGSLDVLTPEQVLADEASRSEPPPWVDDILHELHELRGEVRRCHQQMEDAS